MKTSKFLAKLIGLYGVIVSLIMVLNGKALLAQINSAMDDPGFLALSGVVTIVMGLAIVIGHSVWVANWRVAITLIGYVSLIKGIILLRWPKSLMKTSRFFLESKGAWLYFVIAVPLGAWLAWAGFAGAVD